MQDNHSKSNKEPKVNTRELIMEMLLLVEQKKEYSHVILKNVLDKYDYFDSVDKSFIKKIFEGTLERRIEIDYIISKFSTMPVNKLKPVIRNILRMSVYQIVFLDSVPDSAACNEAVKLTEMKKFHQLKGFVNGVLRNVARNKGNIEYPNRTKEPVRFLSVTYSMPEWIIELWIATYGVDRVAVMLESLLNKKSVSIRVSLGLSGDEKQKLIEKMEENGILVTKVPYLEYAYTIQNLEGLTKVPGFLEGEFTVQDVSSMLIGEIAACKMGDYIIDVCAAPGGKSIHLAEKLQNTGMVEARDLTENKVARIQENIDRMGLKNIKTFVFDALVVDALSVEKADIVIGDLPCSGLGVIGKKADIKYNVSKESLIEIIALQKQILQQVLNYVKPGGAFIYSTCTINRAENEDMVQWITENFPFKLESIDPYIPQILQNETTKNGYLQMLPGVHQADGFFMARLIRV